MEITDKKTEIDFFARESIYHIDCLTLGPTYGFDVTGCHGKSTDKGGVTVFDTLL